MSTNTLNHPLYTAIADGVSGPAERVAIGLNWTIVSGPDGTGAAHTPVRGTAGCSSLPTPGDYAGRDLGELAALRHSENVFEVAIALAAINAFHNRHDLHGADVNGLDLLRDNGHKTVIVGRFPGLEQRVPSAAVIERNPRPGDFPEDAAETLLPACEQVAITASALVNGSLPRLLSLAPQAEIILIGPSAPFAPILFRYGVDAICGFIVNDVERFYRIVLEGGSVAAMRRAGRNLSILRPAHFG